MTGPELLVRRAGPDDLDAVLDVCARALQWVGDGEDEAFFRWKHQDNCFGSSPIWVAEDTTDDGPVIVGVRAMMLWELQRAVDGEVLRMARAVDTATLPSHQGRGIFSTLTMAAVAALSQDGRHAIFNTPNAKSGPGYLKMGWTSLGQVPVQVRPRGVGSLLAMIRGRTAAERWGVPVDAGRPPSEVLADVSAVEALLPRVPSPSRWHTPLTVDYLRWRTGFGPLHCRIALAGSQVEDGLVVFRVRQRGGMRQLSLLHVLLPAGGPAIRPVLARLMKATGSDLVMATGGEIGVRGGMVPLPRVGPELVWRPLTEPTVPTMADLVLPLGAVELF